MRKNLVTVSFTSHCISNREWVGFGSFLGHCKKSCTLKPRKYESIVIKLANVLLFMTLLHGMGQHLIIV